MIFGVDFDFERFRNANLLQNFRKRSVIEILLVQKHSTKISFKFFKSSSPVDIQSHCMASPAITGIGVITIRVCFGCHCITWLKDEYQFFFLRKGYPFLQNVPQTFIESSNNLTTNQTLLKLKKNLIRRKLIFIRTRRSEQTKMAANSKI